MLTTYQQELMVNLFLCKGDLYIDPSNPIYPCVSAEAKAQRCSIKDVQASVLGIAPTASLSESAIYYLLRLTPKQIAKKLKNTVSPSELQYVIEKRESMDKLIASYEATSQLPYLITEYWRTNEKELILPNKKIVTLTQLFAETPVDYFKDVRTTEAFAEFLPAIHQHTLNYSYIYGNAVYTNEPVPETQQLLISVASILQGNAFDKKTKLIQTLINRLNGGYIHKICGWDLIGKPAFSYLFALIATGEIANANTFLADYAFHLPNLLDDSYDAEAQAFVYADYADLNVIAQYVQSDLSSCYIVKLFKELFVRLWEANMRPSLGSGLVPMNGLPVPSDDIPVISGHPLIMLLGPNVEYTSNSFNHLTRNNLKGLD